MATVLARKVSIPLKGLRRRMRLGLVASLVTCQVGQSWLIYSEANAHNLFYGTWPRHRTDPELSLRPL